MSGHVARTERVLQARADALSLVGAVRDNDALAAHMIVKRADLVSMTLALASMVDIDQSPSDLTSWTHADPRLEGLTWHEVLAAHRQYEAARVNGEQHLLPAHIRQGQRIYDRQRKRMRRRRAKEQAA